MASSTAPANSGDISNQSLAPPMPGPKVRLPTKAQTEAAYKNAVAAAAASGTLHREVLDAQAQDIFTALLFLRWIGALCVRTFFQPDEYFQALEPAWQLAHGPASGAWLTWEWRNQLRTSLHPVLFASVYAAVEGVLNLMHIVGPLRALLITATPGLAQAVFTATADYYTWRLAWQLYGRSNATWTALWLCIVSPWQWYCGPRTFSNGLEATLTIAALAYWPWQLFGGTVDAKPGVLFANGGIKRLRISLSLAAIAVVLRPTNILIWAALLTVAVTRMTLDGSSPSSFLSWSVLGRLLAEIVGCGTVVLGLSAASDRLYYGFWTFPAYNFLNINLTQDVAVFYGRNPWHYYLSQGIPLLTTTSLPFALYGLYAALTYSPAPAASGAAAASAAPLAMEPVRLANTRKTLAFTVVATVAALSLIAHKEVRFLYPLLPILQVLAAPYVTSFFTTPSPAASTTAAPASATTQYATISPLRRKRLLGAALAVNALLAGYLSLFHQPAPLSVLRFLRSEYQRIHHDWIETRADALPAYDVYPDSFLASGGELRTADGDGDELFALFLTPCHSTPWRSYLVYPGLRARALTCEPPLDTPPRSAARAAYLDEADRFYAALAKDGATLEEKGQFLATELWPRLEDASSQTNKKKKTSSSGGRQHGGELPRYIVGFEGIEEVLTHFFAGEGTDLGVTLQRVWTGWNGFFNEDWRRRGSLVVWDTGVYSNASHPDTESEFPEPTQKPLF